MFDFNQVPDETNNRGPLPAGEYTAKIEKVEKKTAKNNENNKYLNVMYKVTNMEKRNGAVFFDIVNIFNDNEQAQNIGRSRLKSMYRAIGLEVDQMKEKDPSCLVGKIVKVTLGIEKDSQYGDRNRVFMVYSDDGSNSQASDESEKVPSWL